MTFTDLQKGQIFKKLASKSLLEVAYEYELDKKLDTPNKMRWAIRKVYNEVLAEPAKFGIGEDVLDLVNKASQSRMQTGVRSDVTKTLREDSAEIDEMDMKDLVTGARKKAWMLLHKKLDILLKSPKLLRNQQIAPLSILAGTTFDKGRLLEGQSTENFALKGEIKNLEGKTSEELMDILIKQKEAKKEN